MKTNQFFPLLIFILLLLSAACTKKGDAIVQPIGDTMNYISASSPFALDLDQDGVKDIAFSVWDMSWQFSQQDSFAVLPLHDSIQIALKDSSFFVSKDSSVCAFGTTDTFVARVQKMCAASAPNLYYTKKVKYALVAASKEGTHIYSPFTESSLIYKYDYYWSVNNPCQYIESRDLSYGNAIGTKVYLFFKLNGRGYALLITHQKPYLIFHSVAQVN